MRASVNDIASRLQSIPLWVFPLLVSLLLLLPVKELTLTTVGALYMSYGLNIYNGHGYVDLERNPVYRGRPAFPALLAISFWLFGPSPSSAFLVTRLFFVLTALSMYGLGRKLFGKWVGLTASLLVLSSVSLNEWSSFIHLDYIMPFFMLLFLLLTFLAFEKRSYVWFGLAGVTLGIGYLFKEVALLFAPLPVMILILVKEFRCRRNLVGTFLLMATLVLWVLPWFGYAYFSTDNLRQTATVSSLTVVRNRMSGFNTNVEPLTVWRYVQAFVEYYRFYLKPNFALAPLMVLAWGITYIAAGVKRDKAYLVLCSAGLILLVIVLVQGTTGYRVRQSIVVFLLSYLVLANLLVEVGRNIERKLKQWIKQPDYRRVVSGFGVFFAGCFLIFQMGFEDVDEGTMQGFWRRYNTIESIMQQNEPWEVGGGLGTEGMLQAGEWLRRHVSSNAAVLIDENWREALYFYSQGKTPFYRLLFPSTAWYLETAASGRMPPKSSGRSYYTPLFLQVFTSNTRPLAQESLSILLEEYLLHELREKSINYIVVTPKAAFLALYLLDNPSFQKVADFDYGQIQIFKVDQIRPNPNSFEPHIGIEVPAFLETIHQNNPERYEIITEDFLGAYLGWGSTEIQKVLQFEQYPISVERDIINLNDFVQLNQSRGPRSMEKVIAQYQEKAELNPDNPWPYVTLWSFYLAQDNIEKAKLAYEQAVSVAPNGVGVQPYLAEASMTLGDLALQSGAFEEAFEAYHRALVLAPYDSEVKNLALKTVLALGADHLDQSSLDKLIATLESFVESDPDNPQVYWVLAESYEALEQRDEATAVYVRVVDRWSDLAEAHLRVGQAYETQERIEAAMAEYQRAIELEPMLAEAYIRLGSLYRAQDRLDEALGLYRSGSKNNPEAAWPHLQLGQLYLEQANSP